MNIFDRTSFRCIFSGHAFEHYVPFANQDLPTRKRCTQCRHIMIKAESGRWHSENSTAGMLEVRLQRERRWAELENRRAAAEYKRKRAETELMKSNAELLADMDMLNADPSKIFNRHISVKKHYRKLRFHK